MGSDESVDEAVSFGGKVVIHGTVRGDAVSFGNDVDIGSTGVVRGDAVAFGGEVHVDQGGVVLGDKVALGGSTTSSLSSGSFNPTNLGGTSDLVRRTVMVLCLAGAGVLLVGLFPIRVQNIASMIQRNPIRHTVTGFLLVLAAIFASVILTITIVGIPIVIGLLVLLGIAWLLGFVALCQSGARLLPLPGVAQGRVGSFLVGTLLVAVLLMVPVLGKVALVFSIFPSVGATVASRFGQDH